MYRQSPGRKQRSKGIKVKHVLQTSLLLAVCFWLIYQLKHSHDKKREFDESDARNLLQKDTSDGFVKLGTKGIGVHLEGTLAKKVKFDELEEDEAAGEVGEIKSEENELVGMKTEGKMSGTNGVGDDDIHEGEHEKSDEVDKEEDVVDSEEREDGVEDEAQEIESADAHGQSEKENSVEERDHDEDDEVDEAREEHYKADDASSAVTHNTLVAAAENENEWLENSKERPENNLEEEIKENSREETNGREKRKGLEVRAGDMTEDVHPPNMSTTETKEGVLDKSRNVSPPNNTITKGFNTHLMSSNTPEVMAENWTIPTTNDTSAEASRFHINALDLVKNNSISSYVGSNSTDSGKHRESELHLEHFSTPSDNSKELSASENITKSETWADEGSKSNNNEPSSIQNDKIRVGNTDTNDSTDAALESTVTRSEADEDDQHDPSQSLVEKEDVHKDLDAHPELPSNGTNTKDVVTE